MNGELFYILVDLSKTCKPTANLSHLYILVRGFYSYYKYMCNMRYFVYGLIIQKFELDLLKEIWQVQYIWLKVK